jgi:hypothetical protein
MVLADEVIMNCDHLSVSEKLTAKPLTEITLHGSLVFSGCKTVETEALDRLIKRFSTNVKSWINEGYTQLEEGTTTAV